MSTPTGTAQAQGTHEQGIGEEQAFFPHWD
jgi:hypothetical protein